jgi:methionyl aminopeptidase
MIHYKSEEEISLIRESARLVSKTLAYITPYIKPGAVPLQLDALAEDFIREHKAVPAFKGYKGSGSKAFPNSLCISINEHVVHGIPGRTPLKDGDIISVDCGVLMNGFYGDHAYTFAVGDISPENAQLLKVTKACLYKGIEAMLPGNRIGHISAAVQQFAESHGYGVVRELVGHGLGKKLHEEPEVPNYGSVHNGPKLKNGMVLAIEPMINRGTHRINQLSDGWSIVTADQLPSAHFEHNVAFFNGKAEILSDFSLIEAQLMQIF